VGVILVRGHHAQFARADDAVADHLVLVLVEDRLHILNVERLKLRGAGLAVAVVFQQGQQVASHREGQHDLNDGRQVERVGEVAHGGGFLLEDAAAGCETITASLVTLLRKVDSNRWGVPCQPLFPNLFARPITGYYQQGRTPETSRGAGPALVRLSALLGLGRLGLGCRSLEALQDAEAVASERATDASESGSSDQSESFHLMPFD